MPFWRVLVNVKVSMLRSGSWKPLEIILDPKKMPWLAYLHVQNIMSITTRYRKSLCGLFPTADVQLPRTVILRQTARDVDRRRSYLRPDEGQFVLSYHGLS